MSETNLQCCASRQRRRYRRRLLASFPPGLAVPGTAQRAHSWVAEAPVLCFEAGGFHPNSIFCDGSQ